MLSRFSHAISRPGVCWREKCENGKIDKMSLISFSIKLEHFIYDVRRIYLKCHYDM